MSEFIFLFRGGKTTSASEDQLDAHQDAWDDWMDNLEEEGFLIDGLPMKPGALMVSSDGMVDIDTDELQDGLSGYLILEANDMEAAAKMATGCPIFDFGGSVEVRELESHLEEDE